MIDNTGEGEEMKKEVKADMPKIAVVIPAYRAAASIEEVIRGIPAWVSLIVVVEDGGGDNTAGLVSSMAITDPRIHLVCHSSNQGVGGAVVSGYRLACQLGAEIIVKIDSDGQMDPFYIDKLILPLLNDEADYSKGNRFMNSNVLKNMPKVRLIGNSALSFLLKITSGYWNVMDPTNGYTAIHTAILEKLDLNKISKRYFFESDMLIHLNIINAVVQDINIPSKYGNEVSFLSLGKAIIQFPFKLTKGFVKRIFLKYFIYDFNMASVYILLGLPMFFLGILLGLIGWRDSIIHGTAKPLGTIMLLALTITLSFQMLLQAISIDINSTPKRRNKLR